MYNDVGTLAERVRAMRAYLRMSRATLAEISGVSKSTIERIETGVTENIRFETADRLGRALGCSLEWISSGLEAVPFPLDETGLKTMREWEGGDPLARRRVTPVYRLATWPLVKKRGVCHARQG